MAIMVLALVLAPGRAAGPDSAGAADAHPVRRARYCRLCRCRSRAGDGAAARLKGTKAMWSAVKRAYAYVLSAGRGKPLAPLSTADIGLGADRQALSGSPSASSPASCSVRARRWSFPRSTSPTRSSSTGSRATAWSSAMASFLGIPGRPQNLGRARRHRRRHLGGARARRRAGDLATCCSGTAFSGFARHHRHVFLLGKAPFGHRCGGSGGIRRGDLVRIHLFLGQAVHRGHRGRGAVSRRLHACRHPGPVAPRSCLWRRPAWVEFRLASASGAGGAGHRAGGAHRDGWRHAMLPAVSAALVVLLAGLIDWLTWGVPVPFVLAEFCDQPVAGQGGDVRDTAGLWYLSHYLRMPRPALPPSGLAFCCWRRVARRCCWLCRSSFWCRIRSSGTRNTGSCIRPCPLCSRWPASAPPSCSPWRRAACRCQSGAGVLWHSPSPGC